LQGSFFYVADDAVLLIQVDFAVLPAIILVIRVVNTWFDISQVNSCRDNFFTGCGEVGIGRLSTADPLIDGWRQAAPVASKPRTLVITPLITEIKFISGGSRFWAGSLAGSSAVILKVTITEKETGKVIATPIFYAKAAAMGGAWTFGATDNIMLVRIANRLTDYLAANYASAVGGPTGVDSSD
jgi:hypothetical protein